MKGPNAHLTFGTVLFNKDATATKRETRAKVVKSRSHRGRRFKPLWVLPHIGWGQSKKSSLGCDIGGWRVKAFLVSLDLSPPPPRAGEKVGPELWE